MRGAWTEESERGEGGHPYHGCFPCAQYREGRRHQFFSLDVFRLQDEGCNGKTKFAPARALCFDVKEQDEGREEEEGVHGGGRGAAAAVSSAIYLCVREGGGNMAAVMCMHAIEYDGVKEHT